MVLFTSAGIALWWHRRLRMACRLVAEGEEVGFLGLIDTDNPAVAARRRSIGERISLTWKAQTKGTRLEKVGALGKRVWNRPGRSSLQ